MKKFLVALATVVCAVTLNAQQDNQTQTCNKKDKTCFKEEELCCKDQTLHHFTMSLGYGFSLSNEHDATFVNYNASESHNSSMRHSIDYRFDYDFNFHKNMSFGAVFNMCNAFDSYYAGDKTVGSSSDDRWLFYVGPSFAAHTDLIKEHWTFFAKATAGFLNFRNAQRELISTMGPTGETEQIKSTTFKRYTLGYGINLGASYSLNRYLSVDGFIGYTGGNVSKLKTADATIDLDDNENLSRLSLNVGIKIKL